MDCIELWTPFVLKLHAFILKVIEELQTAPVNNEEKELLQLLSTPHLRVKKKPPKHTRELAQVSLHNSNSILRRKGYVGQS